MSVRVDLTSVAEALQRRYAGTQPALNVRLSDDGRLLTVLPAKREDAPPAPEPLKQATRAPPRGKAFELYVSAENASAAELTQRVAPPVQPVSALVLQSGLRQQMWTLAGPQGDRIVIRLHLGDGMTTEEGQQLLDTVKQRVLR